MLSPKPAALLAGTLASPATSSFRAAAHSSQESGVKAAAAAPPPPQQPAPAQDAAAKPDWDVPVKARSSKHSELLNALPAGGWSQESAAHAAGSQAGGTAAPWGLETGGHVLSSQASWLRLALATPQLPPPLFMPSSQVP